MVGDKQKLWLRTLATVPPGGWKYRDPDTEFEITAPDFEALADLVEVHRQYKGLSREGYPDEIEHQICEGLDEAWVQDKPRI